MQGAGAFRGSSPFVLYPVGVTSRRTTTFRAKLRHLFRGMFSADCGRNMHSTIRSLVATDDRHRRPDRAHGRADQGHDANSPRVRDGDRQGPSPGPRSRAGGLRDLRQRQAANAHQLLQRAAADHRGDHAGHERQHDARPRLREAGRGAVHHPHASGGQGQDRRVQRQAGDPSGAGPSLHRQSRPADPPDEGARLRLSDALVRRGGFQHREARAAFRGARS